MATITLKSGTLYSGPGKDYVVAATGVNGRSAELLWREGNYYYVRPNNMNVQGYISASDVTMPIGTKYDIFSPVVNNSAKRYVNMVAVAFLGQKTSDRNTTSPESGQAVYFLGKKDGSLGFIEYSRVNPARKFRAWYSHMSLSSAPPSDMTASEYLDIITEVNPYNYEKDEKYSYCNEFAFDVMKECGTPLPDKTQDPGVAAVCEEMQNKLRGNNYGRWREITFDEAQIRANNGGPAIAITHDHVAVVRPYGSFVPSSIGKVRIAQAGDTCYLDTSLEYGWQSNRFPEIEFYAWYY